MNVIRLLAAFALMSVLASCGGGESASVVTTSTSTTTSAPALPRDEATELERSLHTTDLQITVSTASPPMVVVTNNGPNPADDVWVEGTWSGPSGDTPIGCETVADDFHCPIGVLPARETVSRPFVVVGAGSLEYFVVDRAGADSDPTNNRRTFP